MENSPPHSKTAPPQTSEFANWTKYHSEFWRRPFFFFFFFFWRPPNFGRKKPLNFGRKMTLNFGEDLFFFWKPPNFGRKKPLNFGRKMTLNFGEDLFFFFFFFFLETTQLCAEKSYEFPSFPRHFVSRSMKIRVKVVCTLLTLSK